MYEKQTLVLVSFLSLSFLGIEYFISSLKNLNLFRCNFLFFILFTENKTFIDYTQGSHKVLM